MQLPVPGMFGNDPLLIAPVLPKLQPFSFGDDPSNVGESVTVQCTISVGDLPVEFLWFHNGTPIRADPSIQTGKFGKKVNVLTIDPISEEHFGNYTCVASNVAGNVTYSSELVVNG